MPHPPASPWRLRPLFGRLAQRVLCDGCASKSFVKRLANLILWRCSDLGKCLHRTTDGCHPHMLPMQTRCPTSCNKIEDPHSMRKNLLCSRYLSKRKAAVRRGHLCQSAHRRQRRMRAEFDESRTQSMTQICQNLWLNEEPCRASFIHTLHTTACVSRSGASWCIGKPCREASLAEQNPFHCAFFCQTGLMSHGQRDNELTSARKR